MHRMRATCAYSGCRDTGMLWHASCGAYRFWLQAAAHVVGMQLQSQQGLLLAAGAVAKHGTSLHHKLLTQACSQMWIDL